MKAYTDHPSYREYERILKNTLTLEYPFDDRNAIDKALAALLAVHKRISIFNDRQVRAVFKSRTGKMLLPSEDTITSLSVNPFRSEPHLAVLRKKWISANTDLIVSLTGNHKKRCHNIIVMALTDGYGRDRLIGELRNQLSVSKKRAALIAEDQIHKANADLNHYRFRQMGVTHYIWRAIDDSRTRPHHREWNGRKFAYDDPDMPLPSEEVRCRCHDEPIFDDLEPIAPVKEDDETQPIRPRYYKRKKDRRGVFGRYTDSGEGRDSDLP